MDTKKKNLKIRILSYLQKVENATSRILSNKCKIERCSITYPLNRLVEANLIEIAKRDKCKVTGRTVNHYSIIEE